MIRSVTAGLALAILLSGCSTVRLDAGRALLVSELAVDAANKSAATAATTGACPGTCATDLKATLITANSALDVAHAAYTAGNKSSAASALTTALKAVADSQSLLGAH